MPYTVEISAAARRDIRRFPTSVPIEKAIYRLADQPRPRGSLKLVGDGSYRIRVGRFRVIYEVLDKRQLVRIARILRRNESTYRRLR